MRNPYARSAASRPILGWRRSAVGAAPMSIWAAGLPECIGFRLPGTNQRMRRRPTRPGQLDRPRDMEYLLSFPDAQVAQLVEHATENRSVGGSIPPLGTSQIKHLGRLFRKAFPGPRTLCGPAGGKGGHSAYAPHPGGRFHLAACRKRCQAIPTGCRHPRRIHVTGRRHEQERFAWQTMRRTGGG